MTKSEQARADAMADAETLLSALKVCKHDTVQCYVDGAWASACS